MLAQSSVAPRCLSPTVAPVNPVRRYAPAQFDTKGTEPALQRPTNVMFGSEGDPSPVAALAGRTIPGAAAASAALTTAISAARTVQLMPSLLFLVLLPRRRAGPGQVQRVRGRVLPVLGRHRDDGPARDVERQRHGHRPVVRRCRRDDRVPSGRDV